MIKEKKRKTKYNFKKNKAQLIFEYLRTVLFSILVAVVITSCLAIKAQNEMIKNIYITQEEQRIYDKELALEIITQTNIVKDLKHKSYSVCMYAGEIYEKAGDYVNAQRAYRLALQKTRLNKYKVYYRLICVCLATENIKEALSILENIKDISDKDLIKFKTRSNLTIGDKYYSIGKFLSAAKIYEQAKFYYDKFSKKDSKVEESIKNRIVNSYIQVADIMVKNGYNSEAVRYLKKAEKYSPKNIEIRYKLAIILSDSDPEESIKYFDSLLEEIPQDIDYSVFNNALYKSANIADLDGRHTKAKYYRYMTHSLDLFLNRKVVYKNDFEIILKSYSSNKRFFNYPVKATYLFLNNSNHNIVNLKGDFILYYNDKPKEKITKVIADKNNPLIINMERPCEVAVDFKKKIYSKKDLENYIIKIYLYKDEKYKTLVYANRVTY